MRIVQLDGDVRAVEIIEVEPVSRRISRSSGHSGRLFQKPEGFLSRHEIATHRGKTRAASSDAQMGTVIRCH